MDKARSTPVAGINSRSLLLAGLFAVGLCLFTLWGDYVVNASLMAGSFPPLAAFFLFVLFVVFINSPLAAVLRKGGFRRSELLFVYAILGVVSGIPARGMVHVLIPNVTSWRYYANPANKWQDLFARHVPSWIGPDDPEVVRQLYEGLRPGAGVPWNAWIIPLLAWVALYLALYVMLLSLCALLGRQWIEHERLQFPLIDIPLAVTETAPSFPLPALMSPFFRDGMIWLGALLPFLLHSLNSLHAYWPAIPQLKLRNISLLPLFGSRLWRAMQPLTLCMYPSVLGLAFLLPAGISLSFWFFYILTKLQKLFGAQLGLLGTGTPPISYFPYLHQQGGGAYLAMFGLFLWTGRSYFRRLFTRGTNDHQKAVFPPESAVVGLILTFVVIGAWSHFANLTIPFGLAFFILYAIYNVVLMRLVAEGGLFWPLGPLQPEHLIFTFTGTRAVPAAIITNAAFQMQHVRGYRCMIAASILQAVKLRPEMNDRGKSLLPILLGFILLVVPLALAGGLYYSYHIGGLSIAGLGGVNWCFRGFAQEPFRKASARLLNPVGPDWRGIVATVIGALVTIAVAAMRFRFVWWPLHPLGYALAGTIQFYLYDQMWFSIFLAWLFKAAVLRYTSRSDFRRAKRVAIGIIFGELMTAGLWAMVHAITGRKGLRLMAP